MRPILLPLLGSVVAVLVLTPRVTEACSPPCAETSVAPAEGRSIPASAPGIVVNNFDPEASSALFEVRDSASMLITGSFKKDAGRTYFAPKTPLAPGGYSVRFNGKCEGAAERQAEFVVSPAAALPTITGVLRVANARREETRASTSSGACTESVDAAMVDLELDVAAETEPFLGVLSWETTVDGKFWSRSEGVLAQPATASARSVLRLFTACDTKGTAGRDNGLVAGVHDVDVKAVLVGGAAITGAPLRLKVTCDADNGSLVTQGDSPLVGGELAPGPDPNLHGDGNGGAPASESADGCTIVRPRSSSLGLALLLWTAALGARRRSSRRARPS